MLQDLEGLGYVKNFVKKAENPAINCQTKDSKTV